MKSVIFYSMWLLPFLGFFLWNRSKKKEKATGGASRRTSPVLRYLKVQFVVLCLGGFLGPVFVYSYYFEQPNPSSLLITGLLITAGAVLVALIVTWFLTAAAATHSVLAQSGVFALARATNMADTSWTPNDRPTVKLNLHIAGPGFAFEGQNTVIAYPTKQGSLNARKLVVLVDPATHSYEIDWDRSDLANGLSPAEFNVPEDHKTYDLSGQAAALIEIWQILLANKIPLNQMVALPSDPAPRQQVLAVLRRTAAPPQPAPAATPASSPPQPVAQRLQELETLRATAVISEDEYARQREQIISEI